MCRLEGRTCCLEETSEGVTSRSICSTSCCHLTSASKNKHYCFYVFQHHCLSRNIANPSRRVGVHKLAIATGKQNPISRHLTNRAWHRGNTTTGSLIDDIYSDTFEMIAWISMNKYCRGLKVTWGHTWMQTAWSVTVRKKHVTIQPSTFTPDTFLHASPCTKPESG